VNDFFALVRFDVLGLTLRAHIVTAAAPDVSPFCSVVGAPVIIDELFLRHSFLREKDVLLFFLAIDGP
jgi:hypothetical protein